MKPFLPLFAFREAWKTIRRRKKLFLSVGLTCFLGLIALNLYLYLLEGVLGFSPENIESLLQKHPKSALLNLLLFLSVLHYFILICVYFFIVGGIVRICVKAIDASPVGEYPPSPEVPTFKDLFSQKSRIIPLIESTFVYIILCIAGLFLLIIPGIIFMVRLRLFPFYVVDRGYNYRQALTKSWIDTGGWTWNLLFLFFSLELLRAFCIVFPPALILMIPLSVLMWGHTYRIVNPGEAYIVEKAPPKNAENVPPIIAVPSKT